MRRFFHYMNKFFMVPVFRIGLGALINNPFSGYIMVLKTIGRKTGRLRYSPVNYAIFDGKVYFVSGFRRASDWYHNILAHSNIQIILSRGILSGQVSVVAEEAQRTPIIRKVLQNAGFAGFMEGYNPFTIRDAELAEKTADMPLLCLQPEGLVRGASDPGGLLWVWILVFILSLILVPRLLPR
jgi:deazaflavin-dependent oxidoreductase (nitroreductase family)